MSRVEGLIWCLGLGIQNACNASDLRWNGFDLIKIDIHSKFWSHSPKLSKLSSKTSAKQIDSKGTTVNPKPRNSLYSELRKEPSVWSQVFTFWKYKTGPELGKCLWCSFRIWGASLGVQSRANWSNGSARERKKHENIQGVKGLLQKTKCCHTEEGLELPWELWSLERTIGCMVWSYRILLSTWAWTLEKPNIP